MSEDAKRFEVLVPEHLEQHIDTKSPTGDPVIAALISKAFAAAGFDPERFRYHGASYGRDGYRLMFDSVKQAN